MSTFADTSFLCSLYVPLGHSARAAAAMGKLRTPLSFSALLRYEFRQSIRLQIFRHQNDKTQGYPSVAGMKAMAALESDIVAGILRLEKVDFADVLDRAERLSSSATIPQGNRSMDILHVATALHLKVGTFLSFDTCQRTLATAAGLKIGPT